MTPRRSTGRPAIDLSDPLEQERLFSSVADLARAGAREPLEDALERIDHATREMRADGGPESTAGLKQIRDACDRLAESLTGEQLQVMRDVAEFQSRIQQRRRFTGAPSDSPAFERRG
jgi:hypothetical protein